MACFGQADAESHFGVSIDVAVLAPCFIAGPGVVFAVSHLLPAQATWQTRTPLGCVLVIDVYVADELAGVVKCYDVRVQVSCRAAPLETIRSLPGPVGATKAV